MVQYMPKGAQPQRLTVSMLLPGTSSAIDNTAAFQAIEDSKALHARRWQTKEGTNRIKRRALPDVPDAPLQDDSAAASCSDGKPRWRFIPNELDNGYLTLPPGVLHMSALGRFGRFTLFSPRVSHSKHLPCLFVLCCVLGLGFCKCFGIPNSPRSLDLDDRQGFIPSSAMQQKKKKNLGY